MAKKKSFAIIGTSNFSLSVLKTLVEKNRKVTVFDIDEDRLELALGEFETVDSVILDSTNKAALKKFGIDQFDVVIVGYGTQMEVSLITILNLIDLGCENIVSKAHDEKHKRILLAMGLKENQIIIPDDIAGKMIGIRTVFDIAADIDVQSVDDNFISTTLTVKNPEIFNLTLKDAKLTGTKDFNMIQIKRKGKILIPDEETIINEGDQLVIFAKTTKINDLAERIQGEPVVDVDSDNQPIATTPITPEAK